MSSQPTTPAELLTRVKNLAEQAAKKQESLDAFYARPSWTTVSRDVALHNYTFSILSAKRFAWNLPWEQFRQAMKVLQNEGRALGLDVTYIAQADDDPPAPNDSLPNFPNGKRTSSQE